MAAASHNSAYPTPKSESAYERQRTAQEVSASYSKHKKEDKQKKRRFAFDNVFDILKSLLSLAALALLVLLIDGARREAQEFYATMNSFQQQVGVTRGRDKTKAAVALKMRLENRDVVATDHKGAAVLAFPDGSAVRVDPNTRFEVQMLDYSRGPKRDRSFLLRDGGIFIRISKIFGAKGQTLICTPNAVAAARGTGYTVRYDPSANSTLVEVIDGKVAMRTAGGRVELKKGMFGSAVGNAAPTVGFLNGPRAAALTARFNNLARLSPPQHPIVTFERQALAFINPALQLVGLTPAGFSFMDNDIARRAATRRALTVMQQAFEAVNGEIPDQLNPVTLTELGLDDEERRRILEAIAGYSIDRYEKRGQNSYRVICRSKDSASTIWELTENGPRMVN